MAKGDAVEVPEYDEDVNEFENVQAASQKSRVDDQGKGGDVHGSQRSAGGRSSTSSTKGDDKSSKSSKESDDEVSDEDDAEKRDPFTSTMERGIKRRMNGLVHHAQTVGTPPGIASVADYINRALRNQLRADERKFNGGKAFPEPMHMRTGRPRRRK